MTARRLMNRLTYFTIEDESMLAEAFAEMDDGAGWTRLLRSKPMCSPSGSHPRQG